MAYVNRIIKNTFIDGPGSRMAVFLQGCNLRCLYCHNPETWNLCTSCGECIKICPSGALKMQDGTVIYNKNICRGCDMCIKTCPNNSSPKYSQMSSSDVFKSVRENEDFLDGITLSGGECTLQHEFIYELFKMVKENTRLTTFIDTNGYMDFNVLIKLSEVTDGFMFDLKAFNRGKHIRLTGFDNEVILRNLEYISGKGLLYEVRTVVVEGFTDDEKEIEDISNYIKSLNNYTRFKLIPFRPNGVKGILSGMEPMDRDKYEKLFSAARNILGDRAVKTFVLGDG